MFKCLVDLEKKRGAKFKTIAVAYEDSLYGKDSSRIEKELAEKAGYKVVADIPTAGRRLLLLRSPEG